MPLGQPLPVEVGPPLGLAEVGGVGDGLRAELGDEAGHPRHGGEEAGEVALVAVVPAEVHVRVGAVELRAGAARRRSGG